MSDLKRCKTDNASGDRHLLKNDFTEIRKDAVECVPPNSNLGFSSIDDNDCDCMSHSTTIHHWASSFI